jgi:hypothetical protein
VKTARLAFALITTLIASPVFAGQLTVVYTTFLFPKPSTGTKQTYALESFIVDTGSLASWACSFAWAGQGSATIGNCTKTTYVGFQPPAGNYSVFGPAFPAAAPNPTSFIAIDQSSRTVIGCIDSGCGKVSLP